MIQYEVEECSAEICLDKYPLKAGCTYNSSVVGDIDNHVIAVFFDLKEAQAYLKSKKTSIYKFSNVHRLYAQVTEYALVERIYDEPDERWADQADTIAFSSL